MSRSSCVVVAVSLISLNIFSKWGMKPVFLIIQPNRKGLPYGNPEQPEEPNQEQPEEPNPEQREPGPIPEPEQPENPEPNQEP